MDDLTLEQVTWLIGFLYDGKRDAMKKVREAEDVMYKSILNRYTDDAAKARSQALEHMEQTIDFRRKVIRGKFDPVIKALEKEEKELKSVCFPGDEEKFFVRSLERRPNDDLEDALWEQVRQDRR